MKLAVGVDIGNTKTVAVACGFDGRLSGIGRGGCGNWEELGEKRAAEVIKGVVDEALAMAGADPNELAYAHMGMAGLDWPDDEPRLRAALVRAGLTCELTLENDAFLTVRAGAPEGHGIGVTAGTGICVAIVRPDGQKYFYGAFTDLGGGIDTATPAFQAVVRAEDGRGRATALTEALLAATGHTSTRDLVYDVHRRGNHVSHTVLNRLLFAAAEEGDPVAVEIVTRFGAELAHAAASLLRRYGLAEQEIAVVAAGSRFAKTGPVLFEAFRRDVLAVSPRARVILSEQPPVVGAVRGALEARGRTAPETWAEVLRSAARTGWFREDMGAPSGGEADAV